MSVSALAWAFIRGAGRNQDIDMPVRVQKMQQATEAIAAAFRRPDYAKEYEDMAQELAKIPSEQRLEALKCELVLRHGCWSDTLFFADPCWRPSKTKTRDDKRTLCSLRTIS